MSAKNIICADFYKDIYYEYNSFFMPCSKNKISEKSSFIVSYFEAKNLATTKLRDIKSQSVGAEILAKTYEELMLEPEKKYKIEFIKDGDICSVFVAKNLSEIFSHQSPIDLLIPAPLLMSAFYTLNILEPFSTDCFIFFDKDEAFLAIYKSGKFALHHSIIAPKQIEKLKTKELEIDSLAPCMEQIKETLKSLYSIDQIAPKRLFISSYLGDIAGLPNQAEAALGISSQGFSELIKSEVEPINAMLGLYARGFMRRGVGLNFSTFLRPPPLYKRRSGAFVLGLGAAFLLGVLYPFYTLILAISLDFKAQNAELELTKQLPESGRLQAELSQKQKQISEIKSEIESKKAQISLKAGALEALVQKSSTKSLASELYEISKAINSANVKAKKISIDGDTITLFLVSNSYSSLNNFIQNMVAHPGYSAQSKQIKNNQNGFESSVSIRSEL